MTNRTKLSLPGEFLTIAAMVFNSFAVTLLIKADFGISAISSVPYVFSVAFPVLTNGIWNALMARYPASEVAPWSMLVPIVGIASSWAVFGEIPRPLELAAGLLVIGGVILASRAPRPRIG